MSNYYRDLAVARACGTLDEEIKCPPIKECKQKKVVECTERHRKDGSILSSTTKVYDEKGKEIKEPIKIVQVDATGKSGPRMKSEMRPLSSLAPKNA